MEIAFNMHKRLALAGLAFSLLFTQYGCGDRADIYYEAGRRYENEYEYPKAIRNYELVATAFKRSPLAPGAAAAANKCLAETHLDAAEELVFEGATYTALAEIAVARRLYADNPRLLYAAGFAHLHIGPPEIALSEFDECVRRYPENPYGYLGRGEYFRYRQEREAAFADFVRAYRASGGDVKTRAAAFRGMRDMATKLGQSENSLRPFLTESRASVPAAAFNYWVGYYYLHKQPVVVETALRYFRESLAAKGSAVYTARAQAGIAECFYFYKKYAQARTFIDKALAADAENDYYLKVAARTYAGLGLPPPVKKRPQK